MKKLLSLVVALMLLFGAACAEGAVVTDGLGREVVIQRPPETCVSLTPANTEILFALGLEEKLIGVDNQSDYPPAALDIAKMGDYYQPNIEAVVALAPDVVFASTKLQIEAIEQLASLGMTVVCNDPTTLEGVVPGIELIANVMGVDADPVTAPIQDALASAGQGTQRAQAPKVYYAVSFGEYGNFTAGPGNFIDEMITLCGGVNVAGDMPVPWPEYSMEKLAADDPDILLVSDYTGDGSQVAQIAQTPGYSELRCVREGHVYPIDANLSSRPGPRIGEALRLIGDALDNASN